MELHRSMSKDKPVGVGTGYTGTTLTEEGLSFLSNTITKEHST